MRQKHLAVAALVLAAALMATGCNNPTNDLVTIHYKQLGSCNGFNNGSGVTSAGPSRAYATFRISTVANKDSAARDFNFDPNRIYINESPRAFTSTHLNLSQLNPFYATARLVSKGTTETINGAVIAGGFNGCGGRGQRGEQDVVPAALRHAGRRSGCLPGQGQLNPDDLAGDARLHRHQFLIRKEGWPLRT
jgi:hypothetical protein